MVSKSCPTAALVISVNITVVTRWLVLITVFTMKSLLNYLKTKMYHLCHVTLRTMVDTILNKVCLMIMHPKLNIS